jgi:hypothetical protein
LVRPHFKIESSRDYLWALRYGMHMGDSGVNTFNISNIPANIDPGEHLSKWIGAEILTIIQDMLEFGACRELGLQGLVRILHPLILASFWHSLTAQQFFSSVVDIQYHGKRPRWRLVYADKDLGPSPKVYTFDLLIQFTQAESEADDHLQ